MIRSDILKKIEGEYVLVSKTGGKVLRKFGKNKPSKEELAEAEKQIQFFKNRNDGIVQQLVQQKKIEAKGRPVRIGKQPRQKSAIRIEEQYNRALQKMFKQMREIVRSNLLEQLPAIIAASDQLRPKADSVRSDQGILKQVTALFAATRGSIEREVGERQIQLEAEKFAKSTDDISRENLAKAFKAAVGVDLTGDDSFISEQLQIFATNNVNLIVNVQNELMTEIERLTLSGIQKGERASVIQQKILGRVKDKEGFTGRFKKAENRAKLIARDQISKLNGNINETRQKSLGIGDYTWRDSRDNRVRKSHELEGAVFKWGASTGIFMSGPKRGQVARKPRGGLNPGEDIQCRCYAEPNINVDDL